MFGCFNAPTRCCDSCDLALEIDPKSTKGLYRRAVAKMSLKDYEASVADLVRCLRGKPNHALAKEALERARSLSKAQYKEDTKRYSGMFGAPLLPDIQH